MQTYPTPVPVRRTRRDAFSSSPCDRISKSRLFFFPQSKKPNGRCAWWVRTQGRTACIARRRLGQSAGRFHCESRLSKSFAEPPASFRGDSQSSAHRDVTGQIRYCVQLFIRRSKGRLYEITRVCVCVYVCAPLCTCVRVRECRITCVREREGERERGRQVEIITAVALSGFSWALS